MHPKAQTSNLFLLLLAFVLRGTWKNGDRIELSLAMHLHAAPMPDRKGLQAAMYGPLVLVARFEEEPREKWYRHFRAEEKQEPGPTLQFKGKLDDPAVGSSRLAENSRSGLCHKITQYRSCRCRALSMKRYSVYHKIDEVNS